jgi:hypothetical protein
MTVGLQLNLWVLSALSFLISSIDSHVKKSSYLGHSKLVGCNRDGMSITRGVAVFARPYGGRPFCLQDEQSFHPG